MPVAEQSATLELSVPAGVARTIIPIVLLVFAAPFVALFFYSVPAADDFCNASLSFNTVPQPDVLTLTWLYYTRWSPRWLTYFIMGSSMSHGSLLHTYGWLLLLVALTNVASLWYFFFSVLRLSRARASLAAAAFYAIWIVTLSSPDQQLYWLSDVLVYNLPLTTLVVLLALLLRPRHAARYYIGVAVLSIAVPAQQEIAGTFLCFVALTGAIVTRMKGLSTRPWYLSVGLATISTAAVMLSPGNAIRAAAEHKHLWDVAHLPRWAAHSFYHGMNWLSAPAILIGAICILVLCQTDRESRTAEGPPPKWIAVSALGAMAAILCECAFVEVATGSWLPDRVVMWFQFVFSLLFVCLVVAGAPEIYRTRVSLSTKLAVFTLFSVTLLGSSNFRNAVEDLRGPAQSWMRIESARLSQRGGTLVYDAPAAYPKLAKPQMLGPDPGCWVNLCVANYLHAQSVIVNNSKEECPH
jgi:hypothetical protein